MARDAERQGDNPHFVGWTERAFMMTHHVLDVLESLARRTAARDEDKPWGNWTAEELKLHNKVLRAFPGSPRQKELKRQLEELRAKNPAVRKAKDTHWEPGGDIKRLWLEANAPYGPGDLIKLPNGKITEVTKCLLGKNLFHEPEYHVSTKTGECVMVPVKTKAKDLALPDDDECAIYTCITKDGVKHEIEAFTAKHANSIAEKRYGYANISVWAAPRQAPARLHRALDAVLDRARARAEDAGKTAYVKNRVYADIYESGEDWSNDGRWLEPGTELTAVNQSDKGVMFKGPGGKMYHVDFHDCNKNLAARKPK
jgi:hypothetical protein